MSTIHTSQVDHSQINILHLCPELVDKLLGEILIITNERKLSIEEFTKGYIKRLTDNECVLRMFDGSPEGDMPENVRYCYVQRKNASRNGKGSRACRSSGKDKLRWKNKGTSLICDDKVLKTRLILETNDQRCKVNWNMYEYTLTSKNKTFHEWAICKITKRIKDNSTKMATVEEAAEESSGSSLNMQAQTYTHLVIDHLFNDTADDMEEVDPQALLDSMMAFGALIRPHQDSI